ncbi:hypothetical protein Patl1_01342 [Pistacia atlantica]|uniref:Uncharacterized protein n=1 Tax=Pistacia atlantica TaxID=434234 RepID=A0ACC1C849_9ROSI|nr:hypothetical protein Patl1_01342 [Pistacia atlantica]
MMACARKGVLGQYFGLGSETRGTETHIPDPYGIEIGNPAEIPEGYEEGWLLNVHAIDTRGVEDKLGCTECRCDLYNITVDEYGRRLRPDYAGGLLCCYDQTQCRVRHGFEGVRRNLYLRYTVKWVDWDRLSTEHDCRVEYDIEPCSATNLADDECIHTKRISLTMLTGGYVIYGVAHQHSGGVGSALYREDGKAICSSIPAYGDGTEAGNEAAATREHTGVMGLFYILVADRVPEPLPFSYLPVKMYNKMNRTTYVWAAMVLVGLVAAAAVVKYRYRNKGEDEYQPIMI